MTDKELLELAAKAAGIELHWNAAGTPTVPYYFSEEGEAADWNPLVDDGDALRLAVKLKIKVGPDFGTTFDVVMAYTDPNDKQIMIAERSGVDPYAATRRAIVRAVAEIGKEMK